MRSAQRVAAKWIFCGGYYPERNREEADKKSLFRCEEKKRRVGHTILSLPAGPGGS